MTKQEIMEELIEIYGHIGTSVSQATQTTTRQSQDISSQQKR